MQMTAREYVLASMKKSDIAMGIEGYRASKPFTNFDGPLIKKIHDGKKKTFIDFEVRAKSIVPEAKYNVSYDWTTNR